VLIGTMRAQGWLTPVASAANSRTLKAEKNFIEYIGTGDFGPWAQIFTDDQLSEAFAIVGDHFSITGTQMARRPSEDTLAALVERIARHLPPIREEVSAEGLSTTLAVRLEEQLYAGWTYWLGRNTFNNEPLTFFQLNQLCDLALLQQQAIDLRAGRRKL
jgi:hypothetical protein